MEWGDGLGEDRMGLDEKNLNGTTMKRKKTLTKQSAYNLYKCIVKLKGDHVRLVGEKCKMDAIHQRIKLLVS